MLGTGMSAIQPFGVEGSGDIAICAPPSTVAHTVFTPTSPSATVARIGTVLSELTSKSSLTVGRVIVTAGGIVSWRMATLFCCVALCVGSTSSALRVRTTALPPARLFAVETLNVRVVVRPFTTGLALPTVPLVALSVSAGAATSSVAAPVTAMVPPAYMLEGVTSKRVMDGGALVTMVNVAGAASAVRPARSSACTVSVAVPAAALYGTFSTLAGEVVTDSGKAYVSTPGPMAPRCTSN